MKNNNDIRDILGKIRLITENVNDNGGVNIGQNEDIYVETVNNLKRFVGAVKVDNKSMILYPDQNDVIFNAIITDLNNMAIQFRYNDQSGGLYVWSDSMLLTNNTIEKLTKLVTIKDQWRDYWSENISEFMKQGG